MIKILLVVLFSVVQIFSQSDITEKESLYDTILRQDSIFFHAYNNCDIETQAGYFSDDLEFYHDQGGLNTSKENILELTRENICGKVTRELIKESVEIFPIKDFGAVEIGLHKFYNSREKNAESKPNKFIIIWKNEEGGWKITRVISLH